MPAKRDETGKFIKGTSGNPTGRPKVDQDTIAVLKAATPAAAALLIDTMNDENVKIDVRLDAAKTVMDRVYGKPTQPIDGNMDATLEIIMGADISDLSK